MNHTVSGGDEREDGEVVFGCSATGKPAPTIEWSISEGAATSDQQPPVTVTNRDHTVTSSSNITVKVPSGWSGHADCVVNRGKLGERTERIPFSYGKPESSTSESSFITLVRNAAALPVREHAQEFLCVSGSSEGSVLHETSMRRFPNNA